MCIQNQIAKKCFFVNIKQMLSQKADDKATMDSFRTLLKSKEDEISRIYSQLSAQERSHRSKMEMVQKDRSDSLMSQKTLLNENDSLRKDINQLTRTTDSDRQKNKSLLQNQKLEIDKLSDKCNQYEGAKKQIDALNDQLASKERARSALQDVMEKADKFHKIKLADTQQNCDLAKKSADDTYNANQQAYMSEKTLEIQTGLLSRNDLSMKLKAAEQLNMQAMKTNQELESRSQLLGLEINKGVAALESASINNATISREYLMKYEGLEAQSKSLIEEKQRHQQLHSEISSKLESLKKQIIEKEEKEKTRFDSMQKQCENKTIFLQKEKSDEMKVHTDQITKLKDDYTSQMNILKADFNKKELECTALRLQKSAVEKTLTSKGRKDLESLNSKVQKMENMLRQTSEKAAAATQLVTTYELSIAANLKEIASLNIKLVEQTTVYESNTIRLQDNALVMKARISDLTKQIVDLNATHLQDVNTITTQNKQYLTLQTEMTGVQSDLQESTTKYELCAEKTADITQEVKEYAKTVSEMQTQLLSNQISEERAKEALEEVNTRFDKLSKEYVIVHQQLLDANENNAKNQMRYDVMHENLKTCDIKSLSSASQVKDLEKSFKTSEVRRNALQLEHIKCQNDLVECTSSKGTCDIAQRELSKNVKMLSDNINSMKREREESQK
jgi:hypothetical protein